MAPLPDHIEIRRQVEAAEAQLKFLQMQLQYADKLAELVKENGELRAEVARQADLITNLLADIERLNEAHTTTSLPLNTSSAPAPIMRADDIPYLKDAQASQATHHKVFEAALAFGPHSTHDVLAEASGASKATVSRVLAAARKAGITFEVEPNGFIKPDSVRLD